MLGRFLRLEGTVGEPNRNRKAKEPTSHEHRYSAVNFWLMMNRRLIGSINPYHISQEPFKSGLSGADEARTVIDRVDHVAEQG